MSLLYISIVLLVPIPFSFSFTPAGRGRRPLAVQSSSLPLSQSSCTWKNSWVSANWQEICLWLIVKSTKRTCYLVIAQLVLTVISKHLTDARIKGHKTLISFYHLSLTSDIHAHEYRRSYLNSVPSIHCALTRTHTTSPAPPVHSNCSTLYDFIFPKLIS